MTGWHILAIIAVSTVIVYALIEVIAKRLLDHVDKHDQGDETAPPRDAP